MPDGKYLPRLVQALYAEAARLLRQGQAPEAVIQALVETGLKRELAAIIVNKLMGKSEQ